MLPVALIGLAALIWSQQREGPLFVSGFVESHQIRVGSRVGGRVHRVLVAEGQRVAEDEPLVELEPYDLRERLAEAQAVLHAREAALEKLHAGARREELDRARAARDRAQAVLDKLRAGPRPLEIKVAEARLNQAEAEYVKAQRDHERVKRLFDEGRAAGEEMDEATRALAVAEARRAQAQDELALMREGTRAEEIAEAAALLAEAEQALALLVAGTRAEELREAEAGVESARAAVAVVERQLAELTVRAPVDSVVEAVDLRPGDLIAPNAPVVALADGSELWVRAFVPENRLDIQTGQMVSVRVDSYPAKYFAGHVAYIARTAEFTPANVQTPEERSKQVFRIKVVLDQGLGELRAGMSADVFLDPPA